MELEPEHVVVQQQELQQQGQRQEQLLQPQRQLGQQQQHPVQQQQQQQQQRQQEHPEQEQQRQQGRSQKQQQEHPAQQQQQKQQQPVAQRSVSGQDDYLDCEELYSDEGGEEGYSESSQQDTPECSDHEGGTAGTGNDPLPLISPEWTPDYTFKVLLVGDSGVGKTCLVMRFIADKFETHLPSTVGVDFAIKRMVVGDNNIKLTIWDTAGQERFRALTSTFYRGAVGIIFVYDVTRRETLSSLSGSWMDELASYDPHPEVARMVVANKVDQHNEREVTWQEGADFAKQHGCLFVETSAKHNIAVGVAFEELVLRILDTPDLLAAVAAEDTRGNSVNLAAAQAPASGMAVSCSC